MAGDGAHYSLRPGRRKRSCGPLRRASVPCETVRPGTTALSAGESPGTNGPASEHFAQKFYLQHEAYSSLPLLYQQVTSELHSEDPSAARIGEIIAQDMAMTAKILQSSTPRIRPARRDIEPKQAAIYLG